MDFPVDGLEIIDNGGTRSGRDRRKLTNINYNPERRTDQERTQKRDGSPKGSKISRKTGYRAKRQV